MMTCNVLAYIPHFLAVLVCQAVLQVQGHPVELKQCSVCDLQAVQKEKMGIEVQQGLPVIAFSLPDVTHFFSFL